MLLPSLFRGNYVDDLFDSVFDSPSFMRGFGSANNLMETDVKETDKGYEISMNLPGFKKEDVAGEVKDGYLIISAKTDSSNDTKDKDGRYIRRERYNGSCSRRFYVGENVTQEDIKARFADGVLHIDVPKVEAKPAVEEKRYIAIEG